MAEEKPNTTLDKIESLIVDGQKDVLARVDQLDGKVEGLKDDFKQEFQNLRNEVKKNFNDLTFEVKTLDTSVRAAHYDIKEIDKKLDEHIKQPAH